jgi:hypothetical protein
VGRRARGPGRGRESNHGDRSIGDGKGGAFKCHSDFGVCMEEHYHPPSPAKTQVKTTRTRSNITVVTVDRTFNDDNEASGRPMMMMMMIVLVMGFCLRSSIVGW